MQSHLNVRNIREPLELLYHKDASCSIQLAVLLPFSLRIILPFIILPLPNLSLALDLFKNEFTSSKGFFPMRRGYCNDDRRFPDGNGPEAVIDRAPQNGRDLLRWDVMFRARAMRYSFAHNMPYCLYGHFAVCLVLKASYNVSYSNQSSFKIQRAKKIYL